MILKPISLKKANNFVENHHRHNGRTSRDGGKFAASVIHDRKLVGVAIVGNPLSATMMDGWTAEVLRVCVLEELEEVADATGRVHASPACSMLYGACWRSWKAQGGLRIITYTLSTEPGASLRAAGFVIADRVKGRGRGWGKRDHLQDTRTHSEVIELDKIRWEIVAEGHESVIEHDVVTEKTNRENQVSLFEMFADDVDQADPPQSEPSASAIISECAQYRYVLRRTWGPEPVMAFVMLNPSVANEADDDATIRKCLGFAKRDRAGGIAVVNLYAWRSTDPAGLKKAVDPVGPDNDKHICSVLEGPGVGKVVVAWGANATDSTRIDNVLKLIRLCGRKPLCFGKAKGGQPLHPLMLAYETPLVEFVK